ncbi:MAG: 2-dehydropantoate 2-reductase [Rhizobiaceae bacterium]
MLQSGTRIAIAGAGSIGCHAGGCLALAGRAVSLLARQRIADMVNTRGMVVADLDRGARSIAPGVVAATADPAAALAGAGLVLVTVKSGDTAGIATLIARHAEPDAVVVSLQNGVGNAVALRSALPATQRVVAGMVPFNVVQSATPAGALRLHRATSGTTLVEHGVPGLLELLAAPGFPVAAHPDMPAVLWGKLLLNLNNALNALSGLPLAEQLADREWRLVLATQMQEALTAMRGAGIRPAQVGALKPGVLPHMLRLPDFIFRKLARRMLAVDPAARSSTWEDLSRGRPTEIDAFQGEVIRLAAKAGTASPLSRLVMERVRAAEAVGKGSPGLQPSDLTLPRG